MKKSGNRVIDDLMEWSVKETQLRSELSVIFGAKKVAKEKELLRERLKGYQKIHRALGGKMTMQEKLTHKMLKGDIKDLWREAYPNRFVRTYHKSVELGKKVLRGLEKIGAAIDRGWKKLQDIDQKITTRKPAPALQKRSPAMTLDQIVNRYNNFKKTQPKQNGQTIGKNQALNHSTGGPLNSVKNEPAANSETKQQLRKMTAKVVNGDDGPLLSKNRQGTGKSRSI